MPSPPPINDYSQSDTSKQAQQATIRGQKQAEEHYGFMKDVSYAQLGKASSAVGMEGLTGVKQSFDLLREGMRNMYQENIENIEKYRETYGGLKAGEEFDFVPESAVSNALSRFETVKLAFAGNDKDIRLGMQQTGAETMRNITNTNTNILQKYFDTSEEAAGKVNSILTDLTTTYGNQIAKLTDEQTVKLAFYEDSLGVSADTIQQYFQKQIGFTDEITLESMDKIGAYANNLSQQLNIPMKTLTNMTMKMMSNTEMFGDITAEEATRMSAKLTQLGYTYEELNSVQSKFSSFSGAAQAAGTMAQLTGVQVDAMKMSYLSSEGKFDELIEYQRDSLLKAGMTKEKFLSQSNSMKNAIAKAYGRSQEELAYLLDSNRRISSQEELDEMMGTSADAAEEGFDTLLENLNQTKRAFDSLEEIQAKKTRNMLEARSADAYKAAQNYSKMNTELIGNTELLGESEEKFSRLTDGIIQSMNTMSSMDAKSVNLEQFAGKIKDATVGLGTTAMSVISQASDIASAEEEIGKRTVSATTQVSQAQRDLEELAGFGNSSSGTAGENTTNNTDNTSGVTGLGEINIPTPELNLNEGSIQIFIDGKNIPVDSLKVKQ